MSSHHIARPSEKDIYRYRYQHGVNLGGIFVLEQWLYPDMFDSGVAGGSELDAVISSLNVRGLDATRRKWESHWKSIPTDLDLEWLATKAGVNHIRVPIGYFTLGPEFCRNTPFAMMPASVYVNAWSTVKHLCQRCHTYGIGVLIDFQAAPGGANAETHSGTSSGVAELWGDRFNLELASRCLAFIADEVRSDPNLQSVAGLQVANQVDENAVGVYEWYDEVIEKLSRIDNSLPLYISDGFNLPRALTWSLMRNSAKDQNHNPIFVDSHRFYMHEETHKRMTPAEIISSIPNELHEIDNSNSGDVSDIGGAVSVYVGEYSCTLSPETWRRTMAESKSELFIQFGRYQTRRWQQKASGSAFWTFKHDRPRDTSFNFRRQFAIDAIHRPGSFTLNKSLVEHNLALSDQQRAQLMAKAMERHVSYFEKIGGNYEHWRYADGWHLGFTDARAFFASRLESSFPSTEAEDTNPVLGVDKIGALDLWVLKRMKEEDFVSRDRCEFVWEWEHGFRAGVRCFYNLTEV